MSQLYMIGRPNGAGKTTSCMDLLPELLNCYEYINADHIAAALSPFASETTAQQAGRLMLQRIHSLAELNKDFAFETTMASRSFVPFLRKCKQQNYQITLLFLWLESADLAIQRVKDRVTLGGHFIPDETVLRRYKRSMNNFLNLYIPLADEWAIYNNSSNNLELIAKKENNSAVSILKLNIWNKLWSGIYEAS